MSRADLGYTFTYIGPKKVEFPPKLNNTVKGIDSKTMKEKIAKLEQESSENILTIKAEDTIREREENEK